MLFACCLFVVLLYCPCCAHCCDDLLAVCLFCFCVAVVFDVLQLFWQHCCCTAALLRHYVTMLNCCFAAILMICSGAAAPLIELFLCLY